MAFLIEPSTPNLPNTSLECITTLLPPPLRIAARKLGAASLELLQDIYGVGAVQVHGRVRARAPPSNLLDDIVGVGCADDRDLGSKPLLEGLRNKVAIRGEPAGHGSADVECLLGIRGVGCGREDDVAFIDWDVFLGVRRYSHLLLIECWYFARMEAVVF